MWRHVEKMRFFLCCHLYIFGIYFYLGSLLSSRPFGGVTDGNGSDCGYGSDPHTIRDSEGRPWSRIGRVKWSKESELELELSPGSLRTICFGGILPEEDKTELISILSTN